MKKRIKKNVWWITLVGLVIASLVIGLIPFGSVQAESQYQEDNPIPEEDGTRGVAFLEKALQREQAANDNLLNMFGKADKLIARLEEAIEDGKTSGKNVTELRKALNDLTDQIAAARDAQEEAARLLKKHTGFDQNGKVTDAKSAFETIREIGKYQRESRQLSMDSLKDALRAIRECRQDNKNK